MSLTIGSLFSGIGGLELGLEWAGLGPTIWQVEQDDYCRRVLARHWPDAKRYEDVRHVGRTNLVPSDIICGGFPCQDISVAGKRAGLVGARSGLFYEFARIIRELRPRYAVLENVTALLADGLGSVLSELAASGYDAEWDCVSASSVGAPHQRDRIFILAYPTSDDDAWRGSARAPQRGRLRHAENAADGEEALADANSERGRFQQQFGSGTRSRTWNESEGGCWWSTEPDVGRVAHGVPARVDRLRALGNAVVPQVAEIVGQVILAREFATAPLRAAGEP